MTSRRVFLLTYLTLWRAMLSRIAEKDSLERILMLSAQVTVSFPLQNRGTLLPRTARPDGPNLLVRSKYHLGHNDVT
jgi:hypothetical protein